MHKTENQFIVYKTAAIWNHEIGWKRKNRRLLLHWAI